MATGKAATPKNFIKTTMKKTSILLLLAATIAVACNHKNHAEKESAVFPVSHPAIKDTTIFQEYVCQIRAIQHIELRALEKGYLNKIFVDEGKPVHKGQLLFQIMPLMYQAEKEKAEAEVSFAETEYKNSKKLTESKIISESELALIKAKLDKAKAELALAKAHLSFTEIRAPFDGLVGRFNDVRLGSLVDEGDLLTTLSDNSKIWVYFNVPETEYLEFQRRKNLNSTPEVLLRMANNQIYTQKGKIETIEADFNNETGNIAFRATFSNQNSMLRHGQTGSILMPVVLNNALMIPQKATFEVLDKKYVFVLDKSGVVHAKEIQVEAEMPNIFVVNAGLNANDLILSDGIRKVKNGDKIQTREIEFNQIIQELNQLKAE